MILKREPLEIDGDMPICQRHKPIATILEGGKFSRKMQARKSRSRIFNKSGDIATITSQEDCRAQVLSNHTELRQQNKRLSDSRTAKELYEDVRNERDGKGQRKQRVKRRRH